MAGTKKLSSGEVRFIELAALVALVGACANPGQDPDVLGCWKYAELLNATRPDYASGKTASDA